MARSRGSNPSPFNIDKAALMRQVLDHLGVSHGERAGWQSIRCPNAAAHSHGDRTRSASLNLAAGLVRCFACGLTGDGFDVMLAVEQMKAKEVNEFFETGELPPETDWISW